MTPISLNRDETTMMRGLGIISIVLHNLLHLCGGFVTENEFTFSPELPWRVFTSIPSGLASNVGNFFSFFGWYGVAVFIFLSGYGLVCKYEKNGVAFVSSHFLLHSLGKIYRLFVLAIAPFLLVDVVQMALGIWKGSWSELLVTGLLLNSPLVNWFPPSPGILWYFGLAVELYIIYALLRKLKSSGFWLAVVCLLLTAAIDPSLWGTSALLIWARHNFIGWVPVFILGMWWARHGCEGNDGSICRQGALAFLSAGLVFLFSFTFHTWLLSSFFAILFAIFLVRILHRSALATRVLIIVGTLSALMFAIHPTIRVAILPVVSGSGAWFWPLTVLYLLVTIGLASVCSRIIGRAAFKWAVRIAFAMTLVWCGITEGVQLFSVAFFHTWVAGDWFLIFLASDSTELSKFISLNTDFFLLCVLAVAVGVGLGVVSLWLRRKWWWVLVGIFLLYAGQGVLRIGKRWTPAFLAYDTIRGARDYVQLISAGRWTEDDEAQAQVARADPRTAELPTLVLIIGESTTPSRMGIYGYAHDTTPELSALMTNGLEVLPPRKVGASFTAKALQELLVRDGVSFVRKMRRRGYHPVMISGQLHWNRYCGVEEMVFAACERKRYTTDVRRDVNDLMLVGWARDELNEAERPLLLIIQLLGSHFPYRDRYPSYWTKEDGMDDYDMSVKVTDMVVADIIRELPPNAVLLFTSDHGESPNSSSERDAADPDVWQVPMLIYPKGAKNFLTD